MPERNGDQDNTQTLGAMASSVDDPQASAVVPKTGRSRKVSEAAMAQPDPVERDDSRVVVEEQSLTDVLAVKEAAPK